MKDTIRIFMVVGFFFVLFFGCSGTDGSSLSDSEAVSVIKRTYLSGELELPLGEFAVVGGLNPAARMDINMEKHEITQTVYKYFLAWEKQGVLQIEKKKQDLFKGDSWNDVAEYFDKGTVMKISISPTQKGLDLQKTSGLPPKEGYLILRDGEYKSIKVQQKEEKKKGTDKYSIVMLTYSARWLPEYKAAASEVFGNIITEELKAIVLLKYDPFEKKWEAVAQDLANTGQEFKTKNVNSALGE